MTTAVVPSDLTDVEPEFAKPCGGFDDCPHPAAWAVWCSHGLQTCPTQTYICEPCKRLSLTHWEQNVRDRAVCSRCKVGVTGLVSDHLRFIKL